MLNINDDDFLPFEDQKYLSRWTEADNTALPPHILAQIRAITAEKSIQVWNYLYPVCGNDLYNLIFSSLKDKVDLSKFINIEHYSIGKNTTKEVSCWLSSLEIPSTCQMVFLLGTGCCGNNNMGNLYQLLG